MVEDGGGVGGGGDDGDGAGREGGAGGEVGGVWMEKIENDISHLEGPIGQNAKTC